MLGVLAAPLVVGCRRGFDEILGPRLSVAANGVVTLIGAGDTHSVANKFTTPKRQAVTAAMIKQVLDADPTAWAFNAGDLVYDGTEQQYRDYYHPTWGQFRERTLFIMGNHDKKADPTAKAYFAYTGVPAYYVRTLGSWRCYVMNTGTGTGDVAQTAWLKEDIARNPGFHIMAMWHFPLFSSFCSLNQRMMTWPAKVGPWWRVLQDAGAEFIIVGHAHRWERYTQVLYNGKIVNRQAQGIASEQGIREFVIGTGGLANMNTTMKHPLCERFVSAIGVARFDLHPDHYEWTFTDIAGVVRDRGSQLCRRVVV